MPDAVAAGGGDVIAADADEDEDGPPKQRRGGGAHQHHRAVVVDAASRADDDRILRPAAAATTATTTPEPTPPPPHPRRRRPLVLLLVGIPGSGKSHFASRLEAGSNHLPHGRTTNATNATTRSFVRVNQDALGSRRRCEDVARAALAGGGGGRGDQVAVVIDRCNFDADQRRTWIDMAREVGADVECVVFDYDVDVCIERCRRRGGHETIRPSEAAAIVSRMAGSFRPPVPLPPARPPSRDYDDEEDGSGVRCRGGERFRRLSRVSSFRASDDLVEYYLGR